MKTDIQIAQEATMKPITEVAEKLGISRSALAMWEVGKNTPPTKYLTEICDLLGCTLDELLRTG